MIQWRAIKQSREQKRLLWLLCSINRRCDIIVRDDISHFLLNHFIGGRCLITTCHAFRSNNVTRLRMGKIAHSLLYLNLKIGIFIALRFSSFQFFSLVLLLLLLFLLLLLVFLPFVCSLDSLPFGTHPSSRRFRK